MPTIAPEAEKQSASSFKWIVNDNTFTTKTDVSTRNLRVNSEKVMEDSNLRNLGKFLTKKTPEDVEKARTQTSSLDPAQYQTRSSNLRPVSSRNGTSIRPYYSFGGRQNNVSEDRSLYRNSDDTHLTEKPYDRFCCEVSPISVATTSASFKLQDWDLINEKYAPQRGGLDTRNFIKDQKTPKYPTQTLPVRSLYS
tara:strand:+ start:14335 stop:14919 length:585 start_codon:yes stop_codon:yes gene_type:complete